MDEEHELLRSIGLSEQEIFKIENEPDDFTTQKLEVCAKQIESVAEDIRNINPKLEDYANGLELLALNLKRAVS